VNFLISHLRLASVLVAFVAGTAGAAQPQLVADRDYRVINPPQPTESGKKVEVTEFFWYACPHCNALQPSLKNWLAKKPADVEFRRVPAVLSDSWIPLTRAYYAIEVLGAVEKLHYEMFSAIHEKNLKLQDPKVLFDWVAQHGVDRQKFQDAYGSFGVQSRVQRSIELTRHFDVSGTPTLAVDGKYLVAPSMTLKADRSVDYDKFFQVLDQVIAMARKERAGK
jgi:protein dithiol oxidoreductase (disulfide-forming)